MTRFTHIRAKLQSSLLILIRLIFFNPIEENIITWKSPRD